MRIAFLRSETSHALFTGAAGEDQGDLAERLRISSKAGSSSKNVIMELHNRCLVDFASEWKFWDRPGTRIDLPGLLPVEVFEVCDGRYAGLEAEIEAHGPPDILWCEGPSHPPYMQRAFELCRSSFKIVYSKDWKPWKVENIQAYDLCLVDEEAQAERLEEAFPSVRAGVWDKLIDYEAKHFPLGLPKRYDLCYVAYFRARKNHDLLLDAVARLLPRRISLVFIGGDRDGTRLTLEARAAALGLDVTFVDEVSKEQVNHYVNASRVAVMASEKDAAPRGILEALAADVPVLVNSHLRAGTRYVDARSGLVLPPEQWHEGIAALLDHRDAYSPRAAYIERFSRGQVIEKFLAALQHGGCRMARYA